MQEPKATFLSGYNNVTDKIKGAMYNVCKEYLYIGFLLNEVKEYEYFREKDYKDVYDYAFQELGFKKSSVKNFIAVYMEFSLVEHGLHKMFLKDDYEHFNYSQLCEMLSLSEPKRALVTPSMTVREIRALKAERINSIEERGQTSGLMPLKNNSPIIAPVALFENQSITVSLPKMVLDRLSAFAGSSGLSFDVVVSNALKSYFDGVTFSVSDVG